MIIPSNNWQKKQINAERDKFRPGAGEYQTAVGTLIEVWDQEKMEVSEPPSILADKMRRAPGILYGLVHVSGFMYYLAFNDSEDLVYLIYGNYLQLEGRKVRIEYQNNSIENGRIFLQKTLDQKHLNLDKDLSVLDIGAII